MPRSSDEPGRALGSTLYVVNGYGGDEVVVLRLRPDAATTSVTGVLRDPSLDRPTTAEVKAGRIYVVNGRFGAGEGTDLTYSISALPTR